MGTTNRSRSRRKEANLDINQARQMLPLVKSIVRDISEASDKLAKLSPESDRLDRHKTDLSWKERERRYAVHAELDATESARSAAMNELSTLGVAIIDPKGGVVGFPTRVNGRSARFTWEPGEDNVLFWSYVDEDVRRPIPAEWVNAAASKRNKTAERLDEAY